MRAPATRTVLAILTLALAGCGGDAPPPDEARSAEPPAEPAAAVDSTAGYTVIEVQDGATLRGVVHYRGAVPEARRVTVTDDAATCGAIQEVQSIRVGPNSGLADAVVSLIDISSGAAPASGQTVTLDQKDCSFTPHVVLAPVGAVEVRNSDPLTHNVHTAAFENRSVNRTQPTGMDVIELRFEVPEKVKVKCDLHPWMSAWIVVTDHPYHAITDAGGAFELPDVPPGSYTLEVWHETLGTRRQMVTVSPGEPLDITIDIDAGD